MFKIIRKSFKKNNIVISSVRAFSGFQEDMEKFDFSEKLNIEELKLKIGYMILGMILLTHI